MADKYYVSYKDFFEGDPTSWSSAEKYYFYSKHKFTDKFLIENKTMVEWDYVAEYAKPSEELLEQVCDIFTPREWNSISFYCFLSEKFIRKHWEKLNWKYLAAKQILSEKLMNKFADLLDWETVSKYDLSEDFMRRHADKLYWWYISEKKYLSEGFIREMKDYIRWDKFFKGHWSFFYPNFFREFKDYIFKDAYTVAEAALHCEENIVKEFSYRYIKCSPQNLLSNSKITDEFIIKYKEYFDYEHILKYRWNPGYYSPLCVEARGFRDAHAKARRIALGWE